MKYSIAQAEMRGKMNEKIVVFIKNAILNKGIKYTFVSKNTGIEYQRLMRIFNQNAILSASELICLCKCLDIGIEQLIDLIDTKH